jgi:hypothetical protein
MHEVAAQGLLRNLFLIAVPQEDLLAHLDEKPLAGTDEIEGGPGIQRMPDHVVGGVGDLLLREELPRLRAGGSPVSLVEPDGYHAHPNRILRSWFSPRLLKKAQMQGGARVEARGVLCPYVAASRERVNAADGPFSVAC